MVDQKTRDLATAKSDEERNRIRKEMDDEREKERPAGRARRLARPTLPRIARPLPPASETA